MDSTALGALALAYLNLKENDLKMSLVGPQQSIRSILEQANFPALIPTFSSEESAFHSIH